MFTAILNDGNYQEINQQTIKSAILWALLEWTEEEIKQKEISLIWRDMDGEHEYALENEFN